MKKGLSVLLIIGLLFLGPMGAMAAGPDPGRFPVYVNLGDSIAAGYSADPGQSYFDRYARVLKPGQSVSLAKPGITSSDLLNGLKTNSVAQAAVSSADVITICIGGNNVLQYVIGAAFEAYGLIPLEHDMDDLMAAINANGEVYWSWVVGELTGSSDLQYLIGTVAQSFAHDWPQIMEEINDINPEARVIVLNLYNPVRPEENLLLFGAMETLLGQMNAVIDAGQLSFNYQVADVQGAFQNDPRAVNFSLLWDTLSLDPHPTNVGHKLIFQELMSLGSPWSFLQTSQRQGAPFGSGKGNQIDRGSSGLLSAHEATGSEFGALVSETACEEVQFSSEHASSQAAGIPGHPVGRAFGELVQDFDKVALVQHLTGK